MTYDSAARRASAHDHVTSSYLPACPRCGDLLEPGAKWCNGCGVWIMLDAPRSSDLRSRAMASGDDHSPPVIAAFPSDFVDVTMPDGSRYHGAVQPDGSLRWFPPSGEDTEATRERGA